MGESARKAFWHAARVLVAAGLVAYVVSRSQLRDTVRPGPGEAPAPVVGETDEGVVVRGAGGSERTIPHEAFGPEGAVRIAGIVTIARRLGERWGWALAAVGIMLLQSPVGAARWRLLLAVQGIHITFLESLRLTYIGWFFNNWMPGATGGDFVKAYYIATQTHKKPEAVTVVFLDRFVGVVSLCVLGAGAVCLSIHDERLRAAQWIVGAFLGAVVFGTLVFYSRGLRRLVRLDRMVARLPVGHTVARVDRALLIYRRHKGTLAAAVVMSWVAQAVGVLCMWWVASGLGSLAAWYHYFVNMPAVWIGWSLIPVPGGFGVAETLMQRLFGAAVVGGVSGMMAAEAATLALAMILGYRLVQMVVSLPGAVLYLARRTSVSPRAMRETMESADVAADGAGEGGAGPVERDGDGHDG